MKEALFYITFLLFSVVCFSQSEKGVVPIDKQKIVKKSFDKNKLNEYKNKEEFNYKVALHEPTIFERVWDWIKRGVIKILKYLFDDIKPAVGFLRSVLKVLPYIIAGLVLFFIIKFFLKVNSRNIISGKTNSTLVAISEDEELIKDKNLSKLVQKAINERNFRLAIRYYYLLVLKNLSEKGLIVWKQEKTNEDYIKELKSNKNLGYGFKEITYLYDYVWYGNFHIQEKEFIKAEGSIKKVLQKID